MHDVGLGLRHPFLGALEALEHPLPVRLLGPLVVDRRADRRHVRRRHSCDDPSHGVSFLCCELSTSAYDGRLGACPLPDLLRLPSTERPPREHHVRVVLLGRAGHHGGEMLERMAVGRAELGGEVDVAAELEHPVVLALEDRLALLRRESETGRDISLRSSLNALRFSAFISDMQNMLR